MGVLHGRDLLSSKWITAIISDSSNRVHFIPIKHTIGEYFLADLEDETYAFRIDGSRILQWRESMVKTFRIIIYDVSHYLPLTAQAKELEMTLQLNHLPKVDGMLASIFKILGSKEKKPFEPHKLTDLVARISEYETKTKVSGITPDQNFSKAAMNMINYLDHLNIEQIVTPLKKISEFIQEDLIATDPKFLGTVVSSYQRTDMEHKKVTNTPIKAKQAWMKFALIFMGIGLVGFVGWYMYDSGMLTDFNMLSSFGGMELGKIPDEEIMAKYPDAASLKAAVDSGEIDYNRLSSFAQNMVDTAPTVEPVPEPEPEVIEESPEIQVEVP
tara:strand:- start:1556 stop:2539 length:984 start_codon:yes stop_codon:yes gene_type:complete